MLLIGVLTPLAPGISSFLLSMPMVQSPGTAVARGSKAAECARVKRLPQTARTVWTRILETIVDASVLQCGMRVLRSTLQMSPPYIVLSRSLMMSQAPHNTGSLSEWYATS